MRTNLASALAIGAGFVTTALASTITDAALHATHVFPPAAATMSDGMFALASAYRAAFTVAGGYVAARLAPGRPMRHAAILGALGLVAGSAGVVLYYAIGSARLGPAWYAFSIPIEAIPCVLLGAWLARVAGRARPSHH